MFESESKLELRFGALHKDCKYLHLLKIKVQLTMVLSKRRRGTHISDQKHELNISH